MTKKVFISDTRRKIIVPSKTISLKSIKRLVDRGILSTLTANQTLIAKFNPSIK